MTPHVKMIAPGIARLPVRDVLSARVAQHHGLVEGTQVATENGWQAVEDLVAGDRILTRNDDLQEVRQISRRSLWPEISKLARHLWPVRIPPGAYGNAMTVEFLPDQAVILQDGLNAPAGCVIPAATLDGAFGVHRTPPRAGMALYTLAFEQDQTIYVDGGLLVPCPRHKTVKVHVAVAPEVLRLAA